MKNIVTSNNDAIFALSTSSIKSGVAVIRISGGRALQAQQLLTRKITKPRFAYYTSVVAKNGSLIDKALVIFFKSPKSFTGEDIIEIHTHGSKAIINILLKELASIEGFRLAKPGEFSLRAFENGKMDLTQAEGLADLIEAETEAQLQQALKQYSGKIKIIIQQWREELIRIMSLIEAYIDFPDEDLPDDLINDITSDVDKLKNEIAKHLHDNHIGERIRDGFNIAIIGEPNAGKSSLLNLLAKKEIAIVSDIAGTTRDALEVHLDIKGYPIILQDTAGIRESKDEIETKGITIAKNKAETADLKLILIDATKTQIPEEINEYIDRKAIIVVNKIDQVTSIPQYLDNYNQINISAKLAINIDNLLEVIGKYANDFFGNYESVVISRQRHREALENCFEFLDQFNLEKEIELAAEDLRLAAFQLGRITGEIDVESILDKIFSSFCIGK